MPFPGPRTYGRLWRRLCRALGGEHSARAWDREYTSGIWQEYEQGRSPIVIELIASIGKGLHIVEFGCGEGSLVFSLDRDTWQSYRGFDISQVAVDSANTRFRDAGLDACTASKVDLAKLGRIEPCDAIVAEECLYYLPRKKLDSLMDLSLSAIRPGGCFIIIVHDKVKHKWVIDSALARSGRFLIRQFFAGNRAYLCLTNPRSP